MEIIDRIKAEELIERYSVCFTDLNQDLDEISIMLTLSNGKVLFIKYDVHDKKKKYYLE